MAINLNSIFNTVSESSTPAGLEDSVRSIAFSPLAIGTPVGVGTSLLNRAQQNQTTRLFAGGDSSKTGGNQGDREQIPPATDNKLPRIYGEVTTGGVVTDVYKESANVIWVCFTLSDLNQDGFDQNYISSGTLRPSFVTSHCYRDDKEVIFSGNVSMVPGDGAANAPTNSNAIYLRELDGSSQYEIAAANVINVWAYAGNSDSQCGIFPTFYPGIGPVMPNAYDLFPTWNANNTMENTVFVIVKIDRLNTDLDPTANIEIDEVGDFRFTLRTLGSHLFDPETVTPLSNPAYALWDYLINPVYGCGLSNADIDLNSIESWGSWCNETYSYATYTPQTGGFLWEFPDGSSGYLPSTVMRRLGAFLNTQDPVADNLSLIHI